MSLNTHTRTHLYPNIHNPYKKPIRIEKHMHIEIEILLQSD